MKKIVILLIIFAIVLVGFTHERETGSVEVEDTTLVYVTIDDEMEEADGIFQRKNSKIR